jgi:hypothetical protein
MSNFFSLNFGAMSCIPTGKPDFVRPHGTEIPGRSARFTPIVQISDKYMARGSESFSPSLKGGVGEVGVNSKSQPDPKAAAKSREINSRTLLAFE